MFASCLPMLVWKFKKRNQLKPNTVKALLRIKLDNANKSICCLDVNDITEKHLMKFNSCMYNDDSDETDIGSDNE